MFLVLFLVLALVLYLVLLVFIVLRVLLVLVLRVLSVLVFFLSLLFLLLFKVIVARFGHDICHAPCHFLWKFTCKMPDAPDTTSIDRRTFTIIVRTPLAYSCCSGSYPSCSNVSFFLLLLFLQGCCLIIVFTREARMTIVRGTPHTNGHAGGTGEGGHPR